MKMKLVGVVGNAPTWPCGQLFYGQLTIFTWLHTHDDDGNWWTAGDSHPALLRARQVTS